MCGPGIAWKIIPEKKSAHREKTHGNTIQEGLIGVLAFTVNG